MFTAELVALVEAVGIAARFPDREFQVFSDSLSALQSLDNPSLSVKSNYFVHILRAKCADLSDLGGKVSFYWIPAHRGIPGNERADSLAKEACLSVPDPSLKIPYTDLFEGVKSEIFIFNENFILGDAVHKGKEYFQLYYKRKPLPWFANCPLSRSFKVTINRLRANHYSLAASLARKNIVQSPACTFCDSDFQDINHILWQCPEFEPQRISLVGGLEALGFSLPLCVQSIIGTPHIEGCQLLCEFLDNCNLRV